MQENQLFAEVRADGVLVFDDLGRAIRFISRERTMEANPFHAEEVWEAVLARVRECCCLLP